MPTFTLRVFRGDPTRGEFKDYRVEAEEGMVVLDVIHRLQATQATDLDVRWNCKAGKCGSCSAEIDGQPRLMCMTRMDLFAEGEPITVAPIRAFPLIRDLVTDVAFNFEKAKTIPPLRLKPPEPDGTYRMMQEDIDRIQEFHKCIECFLCQDVCHVMRDHEENKPAFAGPRFFIKLASLEMHPLDTRDRTAFGRTTAGVGLCNITKCCTEVMLQSPTPAVVRPNAVRSRVSSGCISSDASLMKNRGPAKAGLFSSWSRITWQTSWHRKHSMHLWNSWMRSMSSCIIRYVPSGSGGLSLSGGIVLAFSKLNPTSVTRSRMSGNARIGATVIGSPSAKRSMRVMHMSRGWPSISALHDPHLPALQFHRTARSVACVAWRRWITSSTTIPSSASTR